MNRIELFTAVQALSHRTDLADFFDTALILGESRINQAVRATEMIVYATIDTDTAPQIQPNAWQLPADYLEMRDVIAPHGNTRSSLRSAPRDHIAAFSGSGGGGARIYSITDGLIEFRPSPNGASIELIYFGKVAGLVNDQDDNALIDMFPELYVFATLVGVWTWTQDAEQKADAVNEFGTAVNSVNTFAENQRFGTAQAQFGNNNYNRKSARQ